MYVYIYIYILIIFRRTIYLDLVERLDFELGNPTNI